MQQAILELGLRRAGYESLRQYMSAMNITSEETAWETLMPWVLGYDLHRVVPGDTLYKLAREMGTTAEALKTANPKAVPENLRVGSYLIVPMAFPVTATDTAYTWLLTHYVLRGLQARYPFLEMDAIGVSAYGRPLERIRLGTGPRVVFLNASHHANEWITTPLSLGLLERCARAAAFGERLLEVDMGALLEQVSVYLVPLVNPDGVDLVNGAAIPTERAAAEAISRDYPEIPFPAGWKANLRGVDLNLNYPALWDEARRLKFDLGFTTPAPRDYVGEGPLSERESRALFDATEALDPALVLAWHTQGREIYWEFQGRAPAEGRQLGREMAAASGYTLAEVPKSASYAGYKDWFIQDFSRPGYTVEAGEGENPLPLSGLPQMLEDNLPILLLAMTGARGAPEEVLPAVSEMRTVSAPAARQSPNRPFLPGGAWG